jgi:hypothetical protein
VFYPSPWVTNFKGWKGYQWLPDATPLFSHDICDPKQWGSEPSHSWLVTMLRMTSQPKSLPRGLPIYTTEPQSTSPVLSLLENWCRSPGHLAIAELTKVNYHKFVSKFLRNNFLYQSRYQLWYSASFCLSKNSHTRSNIAWDLHGVGMAHIFSGILHSVPSTSL